MKKLLHVPNIILNAIDDDDDDQDDDGQRRDGDCTLTFALYLVPSED